MRVSTGKSRTALMGVIGMLALIVAACGSGGGSSSSTAQPPYNFTYNFQAPSGSASNTIIYGEYQSVDTLSPLFAGSEVDIKNINELLDGCLAQLPDLKLGDGGFKPDQCSEVPTTQNGDESSDFTSTTIKLDPSIKWSDGQPETADDVLFYYGLITDPNIGGTPVPYNYYKSLTRIDDHTLKITWTQAYSPYLASLPGILPAHAFPALYNLAKHKYIPVKSQAQVTALQGDDLFNFSYPTNGPYTVKSHSADTEVYQKNPNFHSNFFHGPFASTIIFKSTGDVNTSIEDFKTNGLDQVDDFKYSDTANFTGIPQSQQITSPLESYDFMGFNQRSQALNANDPNNPTATVDANGNVTKSGKSIFTNMLVRKAFFESINVCAGIVTLLGDPNCKDPNVYATENTAPPAEDYDPTFTPQAYDLNQAKADLASAGYPGCHWPKGGTAGGGPAITIQISTTNGNPLRAGYLALADAAWSKLGCKIALQTYPAATFFGALPNGVTASGKYDVDLHGYINGPVAILNIGVFDYAELPGSAGNPAGVLGDELGINDPKIQSDIDAAFKATSSTARASALQDLQRQVITQFYNLPIYLDPNITLVAPTLHNYALNPASAGNTWNIADWWSTATHSS